MVSSPVDIGGDAEECCEGKGASEISVSGPKAFRSSTTCAGRSWGILGSALSTADAGAAKICGSQTPSGLKTTATEPQYKAVSLAELIKLITASSNMLHVRRL